MDGAAWVVIRITLAMSVICFILYALQSFGFFSPKPVTQAKDMAEKAKGLTPASVPEMTELLKATAALADSLGKIGPAVTSLIGRHSLRHDCGARDTCVTGHRTQANAARQDYIYASGKAGEACRARQRPTIGCSRGGLGAAGPVIWESRKGADNVYPTDLHTTAVT
ncbi:hypothetical protein NKJ84_16045 [Mesorhizobium sp. M0048]|uniref:hypothetical protein n=1 Tax=Mesorhizobium sp. M0048 TaxID=2956860 RepID=UPI00333DD013